MKRVGRWLPAVVVALLCVPAVRPILRSSFPCSDDIAFHLFRMVQLDSLWDQGIFYARWAPDMALGYGIPFFNFYAPLSYYLALLISRLGLGLVWGLRATFALGMVGSGLAAYLLAWKHLRRPASVVAAVAYAYAPYQAYDVLFRGNLAESAAWPLLPLALWAMGCWARRGGRRWLAVTALIYAVVLLTHNLFALIFSPLLLAYGLFMIRKSLRERWRNLALVLLLGLGLAAFFWLPAVLERDLVHSDRLLVPPHFVYWNNFVQLDEIFAPPQTIHPDLINPAPPRALGLAPALFALPSILVLILSVSKRDSPLISRRWYTAFFALALAIYVWLMTPASEFFWEAVPLIEFVQFPWRLLGPAALCLALLVGSSIDLMPAGRLASILTWVVVVVLVLSTLFWLDVRTCLGLEQPTVEAMVGYEQATGLIGTTAKGEYLPRTVEQMPAAPAEERLEAGWQVLVQHGHSLRTELQVEAAQTTQVTVNTFYYPGWRAKIDGEFTPISISAGQGLIRFEVPAGQHEVLLYFAETRLRLAADLLSLASLLIVLLCLIWPGRAKQYAADKSGRWLAPHWLLLAAGLLVLVWLLPGLKTPLYQPGMQDGRLAGVQVPLHVRFENGMQLLGYDQSWVGDQIRYDLYWSIWRPVERRHQSTITLKDSVGVRWSPKETASPRAFRAAPAALFWEPNQYAVESYLVTPLAGAPPGRYQPLLTVFDKETLAPISWLDHSSRPAAPNLELEPLELERPHSVAEISVAEIQHPLDVQLGSLQLLGVSLDRDEARPGDPLLVTLFWERPAGTDRLTDLTAKLVLEGINGSIGAEWALAPAGSDWPTSRWQPGDRWRGQHLLRLPAELESGSYAWRLSLDGSSLTADLGTLQINAPDRLWQAPSLEHSIEANLSDKISLLGYDLQPALSVRPGETLTVTLAWQGQEELETSYRVFLQLIDAGGQLIVQSDGEPANWTRPSTGWAPGEVVVDRRTLTIPAETPAGEFSLVTGMYNPADGVRLTLADGSTAVIIGRLKVFPID